MKYIWEDLSKPLNCFTVRNATMRNLNTGEIIQYYSANTKIVVVQKCVTPTNTYYRTESARHHYLNYAFEASAFGLANEKAPPAHLPYPNKLSGSTSRTPRSTAKNKKQHQAMVLPKDGETRPQGGLLKRLLRRING